MGRFIKTVIFLQPTVSRSNKTLSEDELRYNNPEFYNIEDTSRILVMLADQIDDLKNSCSMAVDLANVFDNTKKPVFYDQGYLNDLGNEIIAKKIYEEILPTILEDIVK